MCGRYAEFGPVCLSRQAKEALRELDPELDLEAVLNVREPQYNVAPTQLAPVLARREGLLDVKALRWGLVPAWAKDLKIGSKAINARAESVASKPMFRSAFQKRRALIPASGYYEWRQDGGSKQPYFIRHPDGELLLFAGIWEAWRPKDVPDAEWIRTFAIITGEPGRVSGDIHDRQPVILPPASWSSWLEGTPEDASDVLRHAPEAELAYHAVSRAVGSPRNQGSDLVKPIEHNG